jgi:hypothetical protein
VRLLCASCTDEPAGRQFQSIQQLFRGPAQNFDIGVHLKLGPDNPYGFGRIFYGNDVNDGLEFSRVLRAEGFS